MLTQNDTATIIYNTIQQLIRQGRFPRTGSVAIHEAANAAAKTILAQQPASTSEYGRGYEGSGYQST